MICFRIEDISNSSGIMRDYNIEYKDLPVMRKGEVKSYIAEQIRKQVNGSKDRMLLSYSKSLAVCLLKYNEYCDNELHICYDDCMVFNSVIYYDEDNNLKWENYSLQDALNKNVQFDVIDRVRINNFILDVSDNNLLNKYLQEFTGISLKKFASPQKDYEVVMLQAINDFVIKEYIDSIYLLYALQMKYEFINSNTVIEIIEQINNLHDGRFYGNTEEKENIIFLIWYLYNYTQYEKMVYEQICKYVDERDNISPYYDVIEQDYLIRNEEFEEVYYLSDYYNNNVVSNIFWRFCERYINGEYTKL